jgi:hypothetical protein
MALFGSSGEQSLTIVIKARNEATAAFSKVESQVKSFAKTNEAALKNIRMAGLAVVGAVASVGAIAVKAAAEAEKEMAKFNATLATMGRAGELARGGILKAADAARRLGFDDEEAANTIAQLFQRTGDLSKALELNALAMDLARAKGISLSEAGKLISMVMSGNARALKLYGIEISDTLPPLEALEELQKRVAGQSEAYASTFAGQTQVLKEQMNQLAETVGTALLPKLTAAVTSINNVTAAVNEWVQAHPTSTAAIGAITAGIGGMAVAVSSVALILPKVIGYVRGFATLIARTNPALLALSTAIGIVFGQLSAFGDEVGGIGRAWELTVMQMAIGFYKLVDALPFIDMTKQIAQLEAEMDALVRTSIKPVTSAAKAMGNVTTDAFSDMSDSADDAAKKIKEIQRAIVDAKTTLEGFQKALLADDQAAAQAYVEQERKVSDLRKAIAGEDDEAQRAELQAELDRETAALNKATPQFAGALSPFVGEQRRRAGLTDFERELEDVNARRTDRIREDLPQIILNINFNDAVAGDEGIQQIIMKTIQQLNRETALGFAGR